MRQPQTGSKSAGGTPKAVAAAKKAAAKPKKATASGISIRKIETSPTIKYSGKPRVSQTTIDNIKKLGMTAALKKAGTSKNPEYLEGIRRMYGAKRLATAQGATKSTAKRAFSPAQKAAMGASKAKKAAAPAPKKSAPSQTKSPRAITKSDQKKNLNPTDREWWDRRKK